MKFTVFPKADSSKVERPSYTREVARFDSCSAYQYGPTKGMDVLYLSACAPAPPDKGERIRAYHEVIRLASRCRLHLACFVRSQAEVDATRQLPGPFASVHLEMLQPFQALPRAAARFALGGSLTLSFYNSRAMHAYVESLARRVRFSAVIAYSSAMVPYVPSGAALLLDMVDVDSEKWLQYARRRRPAFLYATEGRRLRRHEAMAARRAWCTYLCTGPEASILQSCAGDARIQCLENGVDGERFHPDHTPPLETAGRRWLVFTGIMNYYPNQDGVCWFGREIFPDLRRQDPTLEFVIVGRSPSRAVRALAGLPGVTVTGEVPDTRPYLRSATAVVAPLRVARGIQNKVLEALAMGKTVLASGAVGRSFGSALPAGLILCEDHSRSWLSALSSQPAFVPVNRTVREDACRRFSWEANMQPLLRDLEIAAARGTPVS